MWGRIARLGWDSTRSCSSESRGPESQSPESRSPESVVQGWVGERYGGYGRVFGDWAGMGR